MPFVGQEKRNYQRSLMAEARRRERDVSRLPAVANQRRRNLSANNPERFCNTYFPHLFTNPFTLDQSENIWEIHQRILHGGYKAIAATRGSGKTTITKILAGLWAPLYGWLKFVVILGANAQFSEGHLRDIKFEYANNELLRADFPEVCHFIAALEGAAQRANAQTYQGKSTMLQWSGSEIILPTIPGSMASGAIVACKSMDGAIRGMVRRGRRPDFVIADDIETRDSARSPTQTDERKKIMLNDVAGLAGPGKAISIVYLCTLINKDCLAAHFTDREAMPAWGGVRQKFMVSPPEKPELWEKYIEIRHQDQFSGDDTGRNAHAYYLAHREEMDAGAVMSDPFRFIDLELLDGSRKEVSALQHAYNFISDHGSDGWSAFMAEFQNDPQDDAYTETTGLTINTIMNRLAPTPRGIIPGNVIAVTTGVDIGARRIHWLTVAWKPNLIGTVIDYGEEPVNSPMIGRLDAPENRQAVERAITTTLTDLRDSWAAGRLCAADSGEVQDANLILVDAGAWPDAIYDFCKASGPKYRPSKGQGSNMGGKFRVPTRRQPVNRQGLHWYASRQGAARMDLMIVDADYYKLTVQTGLTTPAGEPGSLDVFGPDTMAHRRLAEQLTAEVWTREFDNKRGRWIEGFAQKYRHNHWLDCLAYAAAAANMLQIKVLAHVETQKIRLSDIAARKRAARSE